MNYKQEVELFNNTIKKVLKTNLSKNKETLDSYRKQLIKANNRIVSYINEAYFQVKRADQVFFDGQLERIRIKIKDCFDKLQCTSELGALTTLIKEEDIGPVKLECKEEQYTDTDSENNEQEIASSSQPKEIIASTLIEKVEPSNSEVEDKNINNNKIDLHTESESENRIEENMADMQAPEFLRLCGTTINKAYSGDPLALKSFIDAIDLLNSLATTNALRQTLFSFLKTKLEGRAREFIVDSVDNIDSLKQALTNNIKPDNSKVIEGRMLGLKFNLNNSDEFSEKAESLADALRRTLIIEGMTPNKANEIVIDKTVELCRRNTQSPIIKSVLEAAKFEQPKDVVAKLITQIDKSKAETQVLSFVSNNKRGRGNKNNFNNNERRQNNNNASYNNFNNVNRNNSNNFRNGRGRGRGGNRGRSNNRNYNNGYNNYNSGYDNYNNRHNNVRIFTNQGNANAAPQAMSMMGPTAQPTQETPMYMNHPR